MKKQLRKSTVNNMNRAFYNICDCPCSSHCDPSTSSWYPREAHAAEDTMVYSATHNNNNK